MDHKSLYSKAPQDIVSSFIYLKQTVEILEKQPTTQQGFYRKSKEVVGLPNLGNSFREAQAIEAVEYLTHGTADEGLPRQVRYGYRPNNGYSETVTYRDKFWTREGEVSYSLEISAGRNGLLKRSEIYTKNGQVLSSDVTRVQATVIR